MDASAELQWVEPWGPLAPDDARSLEAELRRELIPGHPLYGMAARAFGRSMSSDDVAFALGDGTFAVVHLTWRGSPEQGSEWPQIKLYPDAAALQARFDLDHEDRAV